MTVGTWHTSLYSIDGGITIFHEHGLPGSLGFGQHVALITELVPPCPFSNVVCGGRKNKPGS